MVQGGQSYRELWGQLGTISNGTVTWSTAQQLPGVGLSPSVAVSGGTVYQVHEGAPVVQGGQSYRELWGQLGTISNGTVSP